VQNASDPSGVSFAPVVWGGAPDGPRQATRPDINQLSYAMRPNETRWDGEQPLSGWHGVVQPVEFSSHLGTMTPDPAQRTTARRAPSMPWDAAAMPDTGPVAF
jgi:hypothetical protein